MRVFIAVSLSAVVGLAGCEKTPDGLRSPDAAPRTGSAPDAAVHDGGALPVDQIDFAATPTDRVTLGMEVDQPVVDAISTIPEVRGPSGVETRARVAVLLSGQLGHSVLEIYQGAERFSIAAHDAPGIGGSLVAAR